MSIFRPDEILKKFDELDISALKSRGFNTVLLDVDNTITPYYEKLPGKAGKDFVKKLKDNNFEVFVFSNNTDSRVSKVAEALECEYLPWAFKPLAFRGNYLIKSKKLDRSKIFIMGDQLLTDVLCGKRLGIYSIYVKPIVDSDSFRTSINRFFERKIFKYILHEKV